MTAHYSAPYRDDPVAALFCIPVPLSYAEWYRVLVAFKAAGGEEQAAREWSASGDGYSEASFRSVWRSIRLHGRITARSLYWLACPNGYRAERV